MILFDPFFTAHPTLKFYAELSYIVPFIWNGIYYTTKNIRMYMFDLKQRNNAKIYVPSLRIGNIVENFLQTVIPFVNTISFVFETCSGFFSSLWHIMELPLVPRHKD